MCLQGESCRGILSRWQIRMADQPVSHFDSGGEYPVQAAHGTLCLTSMVRVATQEHYREPLSLIQIFPSKVIPSDPRTNAKSGSGQGGGQDPGLASDTVSQQPDGYIRFEISLNRPYPVQGGPAQDAHDGGRIPLAHAAVVLPERHIQGAVEAVPAPQ